MIAETTDFQHAPKHRQDGLAGHVRFPNVRKTWTRNDLVTFFLLAWLLAVASDARADEYLVADRATNQILRYDADGSFLSPLVDDDMSTNGGLFQPAAMTYGNDGDLYVTSIDLNTGDGQLLRYAGDTGEFTEVFAAGMLNPSGVHYHGPSESFLVGSLGTGLGDSNLIYRFAADGTPLETLDVGPVMGRTGMLEQSDGSLLVSGFADAAFVNGAVLKYDYDSASDAFSYSGAVVADPTLLGANGLAQKEDGDLVVTSLFGQSVIEVDIEEGTVAGSQPVAQTAYPSDVLLESDGTLLVTSLGNNNPADPIYPELFPGAVFRFNPETGSMIGDGPFIAGTGPEFQPTSILLRETTTIVGDFNNDGMLTADDIDALAVAIRSSDNPPSFDLTGDGLVDTQDRDAWVEEKGVVYGDANMDGEFESGDLILALQAGEYEDDIPLNSTWETGDWSGDGEFESGDLVLAFATGAYEMGPQAAVAPVPEPTTLTLSGWSLTCLMLACRRRRLKR